MSTWELAAGLMLGRSCPWSSGSPLSGRAWCPLFWPDGINAISPLPAELDRLLLGQVAEMSTSRSPSALL